MAEEIALHQVLGPAAGIVADETPEMELFTGGMPKSRFDFDFDLLHDVLYQDKEYEIAYLSNRSIAKPGDLEGWRPESGVKGTGAVPVHGDVRRWR